MKKAKFIYVDKQKNIYPFVIPVSNEHSSFISEQAVQLKEIGLTTPKLYDLIAVETFIPRLHHSKPTVIFDQYIEVAEQENNLQVVQENMNPIKVEEFGPLIYIEQGGQTIVVERDRIKTLVSLLSKI